MKSYKKCRWKVSKNNYRVHSIPAQCNN